MIPKSSAEESKWESKRVYDSRKQRRRIKMGIIAFPIIIKGGISNA